MPIIGVFVIISEFSVEVNLFEVVESRGNDPLMPRSKLGAFACSPTLIIEKVSIPKLCYTF